MASADEAPRWRVKVYRLHTDGQWVDEGVGTVEVKFLSHANTHALQVRASEDQPEPGRILLESAVADEHQYQMQSRMIITWNEPGRNLELALSFEEPRGCENIWEQLLTIQGRVTADFDARGAGGGAAGPGSDGNGTRDTSAAAASADGDTGSIWSGGLGLERPELPPPTMGNLARVAEIIANAAPLHREGLAMAMLAPVRERENASKEKKKKRKRSETTAAAVAAAAAAASPERVETPAAKGTEDTTTKRRRSGGETEGDGASSGSSSSSTSATSLGPDDALDRASPSADGATGGATAIRDPKEQGGGGGETAAAAAAAQVASDSGSGSENEAAGNGSRRRRARPRKSYLEALLAIFVECDGADAAVEAGNADDETQEKALALRYLYVIVRSLALFNENVLLDRMLADTLFPLVVGVLEHDPEMSPRPPYRVLLSDAAQHKEVVPIRDPDTQSKIRRAFRVRFLRDVVLPRVLDDATASALSDMETMAGVQIATALQQDARFLGDLLALLHDETVPRSRRSDAVACLLELCTLAKKMSVPARNAFYRSLAARGRGSLLAAFERVLRDDESAAAERLNVGDLLKLALAHDATQLRAAIQAEPQQPGPVAPAIEALEKLALAPNVAARARVSRQQALFAQPELGAAPGGPLSLMAQLMKRLVFDEEPGMQAQAAEVLRLLLDPERMENAEKDGFLSLFYEKYFPWLVLRLPRVKMRSAAAAPAAAGATGNGDAADAGGDESGEPIATVRTQGTQYELVLCESLLSARPAAARQHEAAQRERRRRHSSTSPVSHEQQQQQRAAEAEELAAARRAEATARVAELHIVELIQFCVQTHAYHIRHYAVSENVVVKVLGLLRSREKHIALAAIRFARACVGLKDDHYVSHMVTYDLLAPVFRLFRENGGRNNLVSSAVLDLVDFVHMENERKLVAYIAERFADEAHGGEDYARTFAKLRERHARNVREETGSSGSLTQQQQLQRASRLQPRRDNSRSSSGSDTAPSSNENVDPGTSRPSPQRRNRPLVPYRGDAAEADEVSDDDEETHNNNGNAGVGALPPAQQPRRRANALNFIVDTGPRAD